MFGTIKVYKWPYGVTLTEVILLKLRSQFKKKKYLYRPHVCYKEANFLWFFQNNIEQVFYLQISLLFDS